MNDFNNIRIDDAYAVCSYGGFYGKYDRTGDHERFLSYGRDIRVVATFEVREDHTKFLLLVFVDNEGHEQQLLVPRAKIAQPEFYELLLAKGADVVVKYSHQLQAHLNKQYASLDMSHYLHSKLGWHSYQGEVVYQSYRSTGKKSRYIGQWDVAPAGEFKQWRKMVRKDVLPYDNLSVALLIGLSAPVSAIIAERTDICNPIYSIAGNSSRGKTTCGILAASTLFNPTSGTAQSHDFLGEDCEKTGGLMSWNATDNILLSRLQDFNGVVAVIDELSKFQKADMSQTVYALSDGVEKARMGKDLSLRKTSKFRAAIVSIGEERLTDRCLSDKDGVRTRIMEIDGDMTVDADHSERIVSCCRQNHGHAAPRLAKWIIQNGGGELITKIFKRWKREFLHVAPENHYAPRRIEKFVAPLMTTAELCQTALGLDFDLERLRLYFADALKQDNTSDDLPTRAYHDFISYVAEFRANFDAHHDNVKHFGRIYERNEIPRGKGRELSSNLYREVAIRFNEFDRFLQSHRYGNKHLILQSWKARGLLNCEEGKLYRKRQIDGVEERLYVVRFFTDSCSEDEQGTPMRHHPTVLTENDLEE